MNEEDDLVSSPTRRVETLNSGLQTVQVWSFFMQRVDAEAVRRGALHRDMQGVLREHNSTKVV